MSVKLLVSIPEALDEGGSTKYKISLSTNSGDATWFIKKRYSELEILYQMVKRETVPIGAEFPKKGLGMKLSASKIEERRLMIEVYLQELLGIQGLSKNIKEFLDDFLEVAKHASSDSTSPVTDGGEGENKTRSPVRPASSSPQRTTFFNKPVGSGESSTRGKPKKEYSVDGEGIRDAIKCKDKFGVEYLLQQDKSLADYVDGHQDTMLHLACIFNETDIALMLVERGANISAKNSMDETPLDVCQPTLKKKILTKRKKLGL